MSSLSLAENHQYDEDLALGQGVTFENHILTLGEIFGADAGVPKIIKNNPVGRV